MRTLDYLVAAAAVVGLVLLAARIYTPPASPEDE